MMRGACFYLFLVPVTAAWSQNLVPNGSFEEYTDCPPSFGYWANVVGWTSPFTQSADYYNACASGVVCSVPLNTAGYQYPADGNAYMGIITYATLMGGTYREVLATQLTVPLTPGVPVYISYKVSPGGFGSNINNSATWAAKAPGMNFFTALPTDWPAYLFPNNAAVESPGVLLDTAAWTTISGTYVPDSSYQWLAIANFYENTLSQAELLDSAAQSNKAYSYVDEVCISLDPLFCTGGTGIEKVAMLSSVRALLTDGQLRLWSDDDLHGSTLQLYTMQGSKVWSSPYPITGSVMDLPVPELPQSVYLLTISQPQGATHALRVIHFVQP